ncbi:hypothetical protein CAI21_08165 [Alkalilimnicola ehrlichii]|uniref:Outer membrane protein beta-barrel domain-containing protein n=1 Tax=Alkalilimnicola ehrlichii TaxID=351052 RepID=A0A3E0WYN3_9GAMM|nr:TorF family putative porin [Alkalilimnicola ehrlichii]RFA30151.1 hypothetical protein CAI21_08165 [Alkalilimnicola ehrlichii]RFA37499.1 hypothetical protein CAL65_09510 [Alkalilimnicola ehrlichii]
MNRAFRPSLLAAALLGTAAFSGPAMAELSANIGVTSNYLFRGVSESNDDAAVFGGLDYEHASGLYVGTWTSSLGGGGSYELDGYVGFAGEAGGFGYDLGFIYYGYPTDSAAEFYEVYASFSYDIAEAGIAFDPDNEDVYVYGGVSFDLFDGFSLGALVGHYMFDEGDDYTHGQLSLAKGDFTFAVDATDIDDYDPRVSVSWSMNF